ncbi:MAG: ThuA domain-containing protein [Pirellulales bacterium]
MRAFALLFFVLPAHFGWAGEPEPKRLLLLGQGPDGHPPATHEYMAGLRVLEKCLRPVPGLEVSIHRADDPFSEGPELLAKADGVVLFLSEGAKWTQADPRRRDALAGLAARGGGLAALHWAMGTREAEPIAGFVKLLGGCHGGPDRRFTVIEERLEFAEHPATVGLEPLVVHDEFYYQLKLAQPAGSVTPLATLPIEGRQETVAWAWQREDGGRSFGFSGLHFHDNWRLTAYRRLVCQGVLWTLDLPIPEGGLAVEIDESDLRLEPAGR